MSLLIKVNRVFIMEWNRAILHRTDAILWMMAESIIPLISLALWLTVSQNSSSAPAPRDVLTYYLIVIIIKLVTDVWNGVFLANTILNGEIVTKLIRPFAVIWYDIANNVVEKLLKSSISVPVIVLFFVLKPDYFSPAIYGLKNILLFLLSLMLAFILAFTMDMIIGMLAFWLEDVIQIRRYKYLFESVASGLLIPFAFMPAFFVNTLGFLPFRFIISAPAEILTQQTVGISTATIIILQVLWIIVAIIMAVVLWHKGLKRYAPPGQ